MKFKASQRALLPSCIPAELRGLRALVASACSSAPSATARRRLTLATETLSLAYNRPVAQIVHALYTDELRGRVFASDAPLHAEHTFWERFAAYAGT